MKVKEIAIGLVLFEGKLLMLQRKDKNLMWDRKWEYPGGKIEAGEAPSDAAKREIREETGLTVEDVEFLGMYQHDWHLPEDILRVHLHCFMCETFVDLVTIEPHSAYAYEWIDPRKIDEWDLLEANADITKKLYWPRM